MERILGISHLLTRKLFHEDPRMQKTIKVMTRDLTLHLDQEGELNVFKEVLTLVNDKKDLVNVNVVFGLPHDFL